MFLTCIEWFAAIKQACIHSGQVTFDLRMDPGLYNSFYCTCESITSGNFQSVLFAGTILQSNLVCLLSLIYLYYIKFDIAIFTHLQHFYQIVQYICAILFKIIFRNNPEAVILTLLSFFVSSYSRVLQKTLTKRFWQIVGDDVSPRCYMENM